MAEFEAVSAKATPRRCGREKMGREPRDWSIYYGLEGIKR